MKRVMVTVTESQVIPGVMFSTGSTNDVMDFQAAPAVRLWPPADGATAMLGHPLKKRGPFRGVQRQPPLLGEGRVGSHLPEEPFSLR